LKYSDHYIFHGKGKNGRRKVYDCVKFTEFENNFIEKLKVECDKQKVILPPKLVISIMLNPQLSRLPDSETVI